MLPASASIPTSIEQFAFAESENRYEHPVVCTVLAGSEYPRGLVIIIVISRIVLQQITARGLELNYVILARSSYQGCRATN